MQVGAGRRALLIIDEAQNLSFEALEELRMLSNIAVGTATGLQSFLLGQPQFREVLGIRRLTSSDSASPPPTISGR